MLGLLSSSWLLPCRRELLEVTSTAKFPGLIAITSHAGAFILQVDKTSVLYQDFENLAQDVRPKIRPEFRMDSTAEYAGTC